MRFLYARPVPVFLTGVALLWSPVSYAGSASGEADNPFAQETVLNPIATIQTKPPEAGPEAQPKLSDELKKIDGSSQDAKEPDSKDKPSQSGGFYDVQHR